MKIEKWNYKGEKIDVPIFEGDEIEIEFYEMAEETKDDDEVEVEFYDMEDLLMKEAVASEKETSEKKEIPENKNMITPVSVANEDIYTDDDEEDDDLEFIELD